MAPRLPASVERETFMPAAGGALHPGGAPRALYAPAIEGIDHIDLVVSELERSLGFYRGLLEPLGYTRRSEITGERGERVIYLSRAPDGAAVGLRERQSQTRGATYDRYALGLHHLAFAASSREVVDERAQWARREGWTLENEPREYAYSAGYYAVFLYDPDGIKVEIVHAPA